MVVWSVARVPALIYVGVWASHALERGGLDSHWHPARVLQALAQRRPCAP